MSARIFKADRHCGGKVAVEFRGSGAKTLSDEQLTKIWQKFDKQLPQVVRTKAYLQKDAGRVRQARLTAKDLEKALKGKDAFTVKDLEEVGFIGTKAPLDVGERTLRFVASDESEDRDGDIIRQNGWVFENFDKNPVFLWSHDSHSTPAIATIPKREVVEESLFIDVRFAGEYYAFADLVYQLYLDEILRSVSVGFVPIEMLLSVDEDGFIDGIEFVKQELLEVSAVNIPANPNANVVSDGLIGGVDAKTLFSAMAGQDYTSDQMLQLGKMLGIGEDNVQQLAKGVDVDYVPIASKGVAVTEIPVESGGSEPNHGKAYAALQPGAPEIQHDKLFVPINVTLVEADGTRKLLKQNAKGVTLPVGLAAELVKQASLDGNIIDQLFGVEELFKDTENVEPFATLQDLPAWLKSIDEEMEHLKTIAAYAIRQYEDSLGIDPDTPADETEPDAGDPDDES